MVATSGGATARQTRIISQVGTLNFSGELNVGSAFNTIVTSLGGTNQTGAGSYSITGSLSGNGTLEKVGAGTLILNPTSRLALVVESELVFGDWSAKHGPGYHGHSCWQRLDFGTANPTTLNQSPVHFTGGLLEIRNDGSLAFGKNVYLQNSSTVFVGPGVGGSGINGNASFGHFRYASNQTLTVNSRNGFGVSFGEWSQENSNNSATITNNAGGILTFTGNVWNQNENTGRTLNVNGAGNTLISGGITATNSTKTLAKDGTGLLTINGTNTSLTGAVISQGGGALAIRDFRSINNTGGANIQIGASTNQSGSLIIGTSAAVGNWRT